jgi:RHS repeat-associated protein
MNATGSIGNPYFFTGRQFDAETGLYYYRARYYSPTIGRFLQTDPVGYSVGVNWYAYCGNNPLVLVDPSGLCGVDWDSMFKGAGSDFKQALSDGIILTSNAITSHILEGRGIPGWADSGPSLERQGTAGQISQYAGYVSGGALAGAVAVEVLGLDVALGGGAAASENSKSLEQLVSEAREAYPNKAGIIENHHITPQYLGGAANGPKTQLNAAYHQQITNAFRSQRPYCMKEPLSPAELQKIMQKVYSQYPLPPTTGQ